MPPEGRAIWHDGRVTDDRSIDRDGTVLRTMPGAGLLARRATALLFVPEASIGAAPVSTVEAVLRSFLDGATIGSDDCPELRFAYVDWGDVPIVASRLTLDVGDRTVTSLPPDVVADTDPVGLTDLGAGVVRAGGFRLELDRMASRRMPRPTDALATPPVDVDPPEFHELTDVDVTLTPIGPVTYPGDDTDRTSRQPFDVVCSNGHANARLTTRCRICDEPIDITARRAAPRASAAIAAVRGPDGVLVPVDGVVVIGRDPQTVAAQVGVRARLLRLVDAPATVSRTHVIVRAENRTVTVTDCASRGRTAVIRPDGSKPIALQPWEPVEVTAGDRIQLGGPTTLVVVDPNAPSAADPSDTTDPTDVERLTNSTHTADTPDTPDTPDTIDPTVRPGDILR